MDRLPLPLAAILLITPIAVLVIVSRDALNDPQDEFAHRTRITPEMRAAERVYLADCERPLPTGRG